MLKAVSSITNAIGALNYKGTWNASTNTPALASSVGTKGDYYVVSVAGSTTLDSISNWGVGDWAAYNGSVWQRVEGGADGNFVNLSVSSTSTLSGLTASTALALDASKNVVSVTNTGTGSNVLANSPTLTTPTIAGATLSGTVAGGGNQINNVIIGTSTPLAGNFSTLSATGASTLTGITSVGGIPNSQPTPTGTFINIIGTGADSTTVPQARINLVVSTNQDYSTWIGGIHGNSIGTDPRILLGSRIAGNDTLLATFAQAGITLPGTLSAAGVVTFSNYGAGTATFNGSGVISSVSDETWKIKDGVPVDTDAMLKKLEPGYWYYNDEKKETFGADRQLGFYAQNVNAAIGPEAAPEPEEGKPWGYYDRSVLAVTVMSLQKALATIESLTARITALEAK